METKLNY